MASGSDAKRIDGILRGLVRSGDWKIPKTALTLSPTISWQPHLVNAGSKSPAILQVQLTDTLLPFLITRLNLAQAKGKSIHLVVDEGSLFSTSFVGMLQGLDVTVHVVSSNYKLEKPANMLALLGDRSVELPAVIRARVAEATWKRLAIGDAAIRGRRMEGLLSFLFGQVRGLSIHSRNHRTDTEEIDIVLRTEHYADRPWYQDGVPFLLVESKNWKDRVGQPDVSAFITKVQGKRDRCRIGIMCSASGFSEDARRQELRLAATKFVIVMLGPEEMLDWMRSVDSTAWLVKFVASAMLR